jgi:hypothetical protein
MYRGNLLLIHTFISLNLGAYFAPYLERRSGLQKDAEGLQSACLL